MTTRYQKWLGQVDAAVARKCGLYADELPHWDYQGAFRQKMRPDTVAARVIKAAMNF